MNWTNIWMNLFGSGSWLGIDMGFWVSMGLCAIIVLVMNLVFWNLRPKKIQSRK